MNPLAIAITVGFPVLAGASAVAALRRSDGKAIRPAIPKTVHRSGIPAGLKTTAGLIERFYRNMNIPIRVKGGSVGYQTNVLFFYVPARLPTAKMKKTSADLEHYLLANNINLIRGTLMLEVSGRLKVTFAKPSGRLLYLSRVYRMSKPQPGLFPIGIDTSGNVFNVPLDSQSYPHALIVGSTAGGKTVAAMTIAIGALAVGWDVYILNPKARPREKRLGLWDFAGFQNVTYVQGYADIDCYRR